MDVSVNSTVFVLSRPVIAINPSGASGSDDARVGIGANPVLPCHLNLCRPLTVTIIAHMECVASWARTGFRLIGPETPSKHARYAARLYKVHPIRPFAR